MTVGDFRRAAKALGQLILGRISDRTARLRVFRQLIMIYRECEGLATELEKHPGILNLRGEAWHTEGQEAKAVAKIDFYDLRAANYLWSRAEVDSSISVLSRAFLEEFRRRDGNFIRRSAGSDELVIGMLHCSISDTRSRLDRLSDTLVLPCPIPWDYGVGTSLDDAAKDLDARRRVERPGIVRFQKKGARSLFSVPAVSRAPLDALDRVRAKFDQICLSLSDLTLEEQFFTYSTAFFKNVRECICRDPLTDLLNEVGALATFEEISSPPKAWAVIDVFDMHSANQRLGTAVVDEGLIRMSRAAASLFANISDGFVWRPTWSGDEFILTAFGPKGETLAAALEETARKGRVDLGLDWYFGTGDTLVNAYENLANTSQHPFTPTVNNIKGREGDTCYLVIKPNEVAVMKLRDLSLRISSVCAGEPATDFHLTVLRLERASDGATLSQLLNALQPLVPVSLEVDCVDYAETSILGGNIWLSIEKVDLLYLFGEALELAKSFGFRCSYSIEEWFPHLTLVRNVPKKGVMVKNVLWNETAGPIAIPVEALQVRVRKEEIWAVVGA